MDENDELRWALALPHAPLHQTRSSFLAWLSWLDAITLQLLPFDNMHDNSFFFVTLSSCLGSVLL